MRLLASLVAAAFVSNAPLAFSTCPRYGGPLDAMPGDVSGVAATSYLVGGDAGYSLAWFFWADTRNQATSGADIYSATHAGCFDSLATPNAPEVVADGAQRAPSLSRTGTDAGFGRPGNSSVLLAYEDASGTDIDVYARRYRAGSLLTPWDTTPIAVCNAGGDQTSPIVLPAPRGGGFFCWVDHRAINSQVYASVSDSAGNPLWPFNGVPVAPAIGDQQQLRAVSDGQGGAYLCWVDHRAGEVIYAIRFTSAGIPAPGWQAGGIAVSGTIQLLGNLRAVTDGSGLSLAWTDASTDPDGDLYMNRVAADGSAPAGWPLGGLAIASGTGAHRLDDLATAPSGCHFIIWESEAPASGGNSDIWGTLLNPDGTPRSGWPAPLCVNPARQVHARIVFSQSIFCAVYADDRNADRDLYASALDDHGNLAFGWVMNGTLVSGAPDVQDDPTPLESYVVWKDFRNRATNGADYYGATIGLYGRVDAPAPLSAPRLVLGAPHPNPARSGARFTLELSSDARSDVAIFDCAGRQVRSIVAGQLSEGRHELRWDGGTASGSPARPGVYFIRAAVGGTTLQRPIVLTR